MRATAFLTAVLLAVLLVPLPPGAAGAPPRVVADIPPVQSLVAQVMEGVGAPALILPPGASPHGHALRPSEAAALAAAEVVIWTGPQLAPWFGEAVAALAADARALRLDEVAGLTRLAVREGARFEAHAHHDHADADDPADGRDGGGQGSDAGAALDGHLWLDPANARVWLPAIAAVLAETDPANAARYRANAAAAAGRLETLEAAIAARLAPVRGRPFVVFHDAYQYFETRFGMPAAGAIAVSDAARPGAARLREIRAAIAETGARCVFAEPQFDPRLVATAIEGTAARAAVLDPVGARLAPGPGLYATLLEALARDLADCLGG